MTPDRDRDYEESQKELKNAYQYLEIFSLTWTIDLLVNDPASEENSIALNLLRDRLIALEKEARAQTQQEGQGETSKWRSKGRFLPQFCDFIPQFSIYSTGNPIQDPYFLDFTLGFTYFLGFYPFTLYPLPFTLTQVPYKEEQEAQSAPYSYKAQGVDLCKAGYKEYACRQQPSRALMDLFSVFSYSRPCSSTK